MKEFVFDGIRLELVSDRIIRIEKMRDDKFEGRNTFFVPNRDFFKDKICHINKQSVLIRCLSTSKIIQTANYYNDGFTKNVDLQKLIGSCKDTITSYVKRAKLCGLINNAQ